MSEEYRQMWTDLGLDLEAHDALLEALGKGYQDIYLSQENRPQGMQYFDFVMSEVHGLRVKELIDAQKQGRKVIGSFCVFVPEELILAIDGISVGLCTGAEFGFAEAEKVLPRNTCALIKSAFGFGMTKVCPYMEASDMIVGENTCDGKKKSYEVFKDVVKDLYVMDIPQMKSDSGKELLRSEYLKFKEKLEQLSGRRITVDDLRKGIETVNAKRRAVHRISELRNADPVPISGMDALLINQVYFYDDPQRFTESVNKIADELEERIKEKKGVSAEKTPRILISGCPMAVPNWKLPWIIETNNAAIVGEESCVGERGTRFLTDSEGSTVDDLMDNIVDRYFNIDCAIFTPNQSRTEHILEMYDKYRADGVIHYSLQFCQPYQIESGPVESTLEDKGIPVMRIETDYSQEDAGQLRTRVEAFVERLKG
ncbi:MAG: 2-hydroxyacyl-CoA dehydratase [candidate division Zixibacteria bacterium]|nr:2-hydroxyacyl-CoA dehydratase [candidate division Zixibacteria bacterium]